MYLVYFLNYFHRNIKADMIYNEYLKNRYEKKDLLYTRIG